MQRKQEVQQVQQEAEAEESETRELSQAEIEEMKGWFRFFDKNDDKQLDKEELKMVFHALCWTVNDDEVDKYFKVADADQNGYIDYDEYIAFLAKFKKNTDTERLELREAFRHFDRDRSGYMDQDELRRFLLTRGVVYTDRDRMELDKIIKMADTNGDGLLDIDEFVDLMMKKPTIGTKN